jgi:hypothetical protein
MYTILFKSLTLKGYREITLEVRKRDAVLFMMGDSRLCLSAGENDPVEREREDS